MVTVKVIEVIGASAESWDDAVRNAVKSATSTLDNVTGVDVRGWTAKVNSDGDITEYHANVKIAFRVVEA